MKRLCNLVLMLLFGVTICRAQAVPDGYVIKPIPAVWVPAGSGPSRLNLADLVPPETPPLVVSEFVSRYGAPDHYLMPKSARRGYSGMLIYVLPSGHTVKLHVAAPPNQSIGAIFVQDRAGKQVRLIK